MRNLKMLGLSVVALLAMAAMGAGAAQANEPAHFVPGPGTVEVDAIAEGAQTFTAGSKVVTCTELDGHAEATEPTKSLTATNVAFTGQCHTIVFGFITFDTTVFPEEGCHFTFTAGTWNGEDAQGSVHICNVTINVYHNAEHKTPLFCQMHVPAQEVGGLTYTNQQTEGGVDAVTVDVNGTTSGVTVTKTGTSGCNTHETVTANYKGNFWAKGTNADKEFSGATVAKTEG